VVVAVVEEEVIMGDSTKPGSEEYLNIRVVVAGVVVVAEIVRY
tara:strand:- start:387 stop:515 length:129 start_codon:yes stop_codon:yes gene_type:complete